MIHLLERVEIMDFLPTFLLKGLKKFKVLVLFLCKVRKPEYLCVRYFYAIVVVGSAAYLLERRHIILLPRCIWRRRSSPHSAQGVGEGGLRRFSFFILNNQSDQVETQNKDHQQVVSFLPRLP